MDNEELINGMKLNGFSDHNIEKLLNLKRVASEAGFELVMYDKIDGQIEITFSIICWNWGRYVWNTAYYSVIDSCLHVNRTVINENPEDNSEKQVQ